MASTTSSSSLAAAFIPNNNTHNAGNSLESNSAGPSSSFSFAPPPSSRNCVQDFIPLPDPHQQHQHYHQRPNSSPSSSTTSSYHHNQQHHHHHHIAHANYQHQALDQSVNFRIPVYRGNGQPSVQAQQPKQLSLAAPQQQQAAPISLYSSNHLVSPGGPDRTASANSPLRFAMSRSSSMTNMPSRPSYGPPGPNMENRQPQSYQTGLAALGGNNFAARLYSDAVDIGGPSQSVFHDSRYANIGGYPIHNDGYASSVGGELNGSEADFDQLLAMSKAQADVAGDANLFACPHCDKRYTGKHARSIWRRHLQDKHNIPLSIQPRRTRWDGDANRPKNAEERRARMLESKRRWARKKRMQEKMGNASGSQNLEEEDGGGGGDDGDSSFNYDTSFGSDVDTKPPMGFAVKAESMATPLNPSNVDANMFGAGADSQSSAAAMPPSQGGGPWASSPIRRGSHPNPSCYNDPQNPFKRQAVDKHGPLATNATPVHSFSSLYPTPPSVGSSQLAGTSAYSSSSCSSPMRKVPSATEPHGLPMSLPLLSPPRSNERHAALVDATHAKAGSTLDYTTAQSDQQATSSSSSNLNQRAESGLSGGVTSTPRSTLIAMIPDSAGKTLPQPPSLGKKYDQQEAASMLLALRSNSNSPTEAESTEGRKRRLEQVHGGWDTPNRSIALARSRSDHAALAALSRPGPSPRSLSSANLPTIGGASGEGESTPSLPRMMRRGSEPNSSPSRDRGKNARNSRPLSMERPERALAGDGSPTPAPRAYTTSSKSSAPPSSSKLLDLSTPGPGSRTSSNPFSLDKHKISPFETKRTLPLSSRDRQFDAFGGELLSPGSSPPTLGATLGLSGLSPVGPSKMEKMGSSDSFKSSELGPRLPPLVSTPVRPVDSLSAIRGSANGLEHADGNGSEDKENQRPSTKSGSSLGEGKGLLHGQESSNRLAVSTPFSKLGSSNLSSIKPPSTLARNLGTNSIGRPTPIKTDQFSSPQHLNLTESLGLAPHSATRGSVYSSLYGASLGMTPSVGANLGLGSNLSLGLTSAFNTPLGAWPDSVRKPKHSGGNGIDGDDEDEDEDDEEDPEDRENKGKGKRSGPSSRMFGNDETPSKPSGTYRKSGATTTKVKPLTLSLTANAQT
ncbi:hypothetical protein IE53DRAFT_383827 [Violaceomyces palustris]|uniref:Uncharacterized protein n=1 Tax=Violaceomyces palustris TaxID=1673888 RepID=A0ACD0P6K6_9BASI|nr:hypothetical protein IE53DRAFT_383827 [Violaceomyces palustris]